MAASINGVGGVGFGGLTCSTKTALPSSRSSSFRVQMSVPVEDKKRNYTLQKSQEAFNAALNLMPGGVNSPVRAFKSVGGQPIFMDSVKGSHMWDIDGNEYIDYVGSWGPAIIGHADDEAGSGVATLGLPDSPGVPKATTSGTLTAPYNDIAAVESLFNSNKGEIAAIILEPAVGNSGFITPKPDFLEAIHHLTKENGALLIFDEVMTGFRLSYGGAQEYFGITPDLTTLGKVIGGGLPVGAYGGGREIMEMVAPAGPMYQAGTLSGNPLAMTAGIQTLKRLKAPGTYEYLDRITGELVQGILNAGKKTGHAICGGHIRGMFGFFFTEGPVQNFDDAKKSDAAKFVRFYQGMLREGVYFAPSQLEAGFTSLAHSPEDIQKTVAAAENVLSKI
ncbi:Glutamate-1-semialdehyde 2,1-aminomutase 2, chloroplastic -like protein [Gossypium arboreum]|uniref:glutamate-1-semialdehyde 2,1-aminomutase n=1 Tax=Gossypium arboreum TaxID=29729 RepID=A0A0B0NK84_GOSAR|nr:Glutamate-1-semialdehyde 2,1-aminomutase 2, chloroplastic -like protein [Gossypium arboreum]